MTIFADAGETFGVTPLDLGSILEGIANALTVSDPPSQADIDALVAKLAALTSDELDLELTGAQGLQVLILLADDTADLATDFPALLATF